MNTCILTLPIGAGLMTHMWDVELVLWRPHKLHILSHFPVAKALARLDFRDPFVCGPLGERICMDPGNFRIFEFSYFSFRVRAAGAQAVTWHVTEAEVQNPKQRCT